MTKGASIYLDATRFLAATTVLVYHFFALELTDSTLRFPFGGEAVMVFFVISGFVIAFVADTREKTWQSYSISRYARLYSVVVPALILTAVVDGIGAQINPAAYDPNAHAQPLLRIGASLLFINEIWNFTIVPLSNGPFWSLSYEFFYYLMFGAAVFAPVRWRFPLTFLVLLVAGPRIALYSSIWLIGVLVYHLRPRVPLQSILMPLLFLASLALFFAFAIFGTPLDALNRAFYEQLDSRGFFYFFGANIFIGGNARFPSDLAVAVAFSGTLLFCESAAALLLRTGWVARTIRFLASHTFSIYLYHVPLLIFFDVLLDGVILSDGQQDGILNGVLLLLLTGGSIVLLARYTENRKGIYVDFFQRLHLLLFADRQRSSPTK